MGLSYDQKEGDMRMRAAAVVMLVAVGVDGRVVVDWLRG